MGFDLCMSIYAAAAAYLICSEECVCVYPLAFNNQQQYQQQQI